MSIAIKNGSEYLIDFVDKRVESHYVCDPYDFDHEWLEDFIVEESYGFLLMPKEYISKDVVISTDGNLYIGGKIVYDYIDVCNRHSDMKGRIPAYYCIRTKVESYTKGETYLSFECGFDLHLTQFWANGNYFDTIEECFKFLQDKFGDFVITLEESMRM